MKQGSLTLVLLAFWTAKMWRTALCIYRILSNLGLYSGDAGSTLPLPPSCENQKCLQTVPNVPCETKIKTTSCWKPLIQREKVTGKGRKKAVEFNCSQVHIFYLNNSGSVFCLKKIIQVLNNCKLKQRTSLGLNIGIFALGENIVGVSFNSKQIPYICEINTSHIGLGNLKWLVI